jgi:hypothetical protein
MQRLAVHVMVPPQQSLETLQPQPPDTHAFPNVEVQAVQSSHAWPLLPQAVGLVPGPHIPETSQHPPLHASPIPQATPQVWVVELQAWSTAQSEAPLQPQVPPPEARRQLLSEA